MNFEIRKKAEPEVILGTETIEVASPPVETSQAIVP